MTTEPSITPPVLLLAATWAEMSPVVKLLKLSQRADDACASAYSGNWRGLHVVAAVTGMGAARAADVAERLMDEHHPSRVLLLGFSGGLDPAMCVGWIVLPSKVMNEHGGEGALDGNGPAILTVDRIASTPERKRELHARHGAAAVDMETFAVAKAAAACGLKLTVVRAISDPAEATLPAWINQCVRPDGTNNPSGAMLALLANPLRLKPLLSLASAAKQAGEALAHMVEGKLSQWDDG